MRPSIHGVQSKGTDTTPIAPTSMSSIATQIRSHRKFTMTR
jgi:hypothetical protein